MLAFELRERGGEVERCEARDYLHHKPDFQTMLRVTASKGLS